VICFGLYYWTILRPCPNLAKWRKKRCTKYSCCFFIWTPCQVSVSVTEIFFISIYLKHREKEELEKEKSNLENEEMALKEEETTNEQSTLQMEI